MCKSQKCRYIRGLIRMLRLRWNGKLIILTLKIRILKSSVKWCHKIVMTGIFRTILIYDIVLRVVKQSLVTNMLWDIQNLRKQQIMQDIQNVSYFFFFYFYVFLKAIKRLKKNHLYMYIVSTIILTLLDIIRYIIFFHKLAMKLLLIFF